ncbi:O6-methylguanine-DNA-alkyltransferase [Salmonella enterica subsp. arizonae]|uniref:O6-methylguanine-DNA-alkyltransferase n=1 Tax=Salmonella enterica subsp. arizonae TaxID=59203 RepID=A0A379SKC3_SALER|nr:O6-methylguanine-DNA-alkyltransferase [Salmonella enterica subsp. arizonae]
MLRLLEEKIATPLGPLWVICDEQFRLRPLSGNSTTIVWSNYLTYTTVTKATNVFLRLTPVDSAIRLQIILQAISP